MSKPMSLFVYQPLGLLVLWLHCHEHKNWFHRRLIVYVVRLQHNDSVANGNRSVKIDLAFFPCVDYWLPLCCLCCFECTLWLFHLVAGTSSAWMHIFTGHCALTLFYRNALYPPLLRCSDQSILYNSVVGSIYMAHYLCLAGSAVCKLPYTVCLSMRVQGILSFMFYRFNTFLTEKLWCYLKMCKYASTTHDIYSR